MTPLDRTKRLRNDPLQRIRLGLGVMAGVLVVAIGGYRIAGNSWIDSIYMVVITVSTVGYGEIGDPDSPGERLFTVAVIVFGMSAAVYTMGGLIQMMAEGEIKRALDRRRTMQGIEALDGHVVVCGFGRMGSVLADELGSRGLQFVIVDRDADRAAEAENLGYLTVCGDATEEYVLVDAAVARAKCLVTALPGDADNVFITLTSRGLNPRLQIIARGELLSTEKKLLQAGADRVVLPAVAGAFRMANMVTRPSTLELIEMVAGRSTLDVELAERVVPAGSAIAGLTVQQVEARRRRGLLVVAVKRPAGEMIFNPESAFVFEPGDIIIVMGPVADIEHFHAEFGL